MRVAGAIAFPPPPRSCRRRPFRAVGHGEPRRRGQSVIAAALNRRMLGVLAMSAQSFRRLLFTGAVVCFSLAGGWLLLPLFGSSAPLFARWGLLGTPLTFPFGNESALVVANNAVFLGLMLLTQWAFLRPLRRAAFVSGAAGRPRWHAVVGVAFAATLLIAALAATLLEIPNRWKALTGERLWPFWLAMGILWAAWTVVFWIYFRQGEFLARAEGVVRALLRGSCLELVIAIPTHALVYRRSDADCYCERGSYTGMVFGTAALLWAFGPGLVLLAYREKQRRTPVLQRLCPQCGATIDPAAAPAGSCPRCGRVAPPATGQPHAVG